MGYYMKKTEENEKVVGYEKLLCEEVMLMTSMKQTIEYNVGKMYAKFKLVSWRKEDVFRKQYRTSGKDIFNGEHFFLKVETRDLSDNLDYVHMKIYKPIEGQGFETKLVT